MKGGPWGADLNVSLILGPVNISPFRLEGIKGQMELKLFISSPDNSKITLVPQVGRERSPVPLDVTEGGRDLG